MVAEVSHTETQDLALWKLKDTVLVMLQHIDEDQSGTISRDELEHIVQDTEAVAVMNDLNISVQHFIDMTEMHYEEGADMWQDGLKLRDFRTAESDICVVGDKNRLQKRHIFLSAP